LPPGSPGLDTARAVESALTALEADGRVAQLLQFDPAGDLVAISAGDLDGAAAVAVLVPGIETTPGDDLSWLVGVATRVVHGPAGRRRAGAAGQSGPPGRQRGRPGGPGGVRRLVDRRLDLLVAVVR